MLTFAGSLGSSLGRAGFAVCLCLGVSLLTVVRSLVAWLAAFLSRLIPAAASRPPVS